MADFDPFSLNEDQKDTDMPIFASFDTTQTAKNDQKESSNQENSKKDQDVDSIVGIRQSSSKPPTFDSDSDHNDFTFKNELQNDNDKEPLFASFGKSLHSLLNAPKEEEVKQQEEQQTISTEQQENLNFPSFGSFPSFDLSKEKSENLDPKPNNDKATKLPLKTTSSIQENKFKIEPPQKTQQQESKASSSSSLPSVKNLLKPIPGPQPNLEFYPDHAKITIHPPKPFKETALAKELSEYCMKVFNHQYVFTD